MPRSRPSSAKGGKKSVEQLYQKKTQLEHILLRPDTYIGSIEKEMQKIWVYSESQKGMVLKEIEYVPGLYKIFDEILVNAADNKQRDKTMSEIKVVVNRREGYISVKNDGKGIPVEMHKKEKMYVPELIFGNLLTSSNYNDKDKKTVGGRNGYGAKLANIFSKKFIVETADSDRGLKYKQTWSNNMSSKGQPEINPTNKRSYTRITFFPDFKRFSMDGLDNQTYSLFVKRVYDIAGTTPGVKVWLNDSQIRVKNFKDYCDLYPCEGNKKVYEKVNDRWEVCLAASGADGQFLQVSHVNSINTMHGGTHCKYLIDKICKKFLAGLKKKAKNLKAHQVRNQCFLFVNCLIENPAFSSQTKVSLTLKASKFGSDCEPSDKFYKAALKLPITDNVLAFAKYQAERGLKKNDGKKTRNLFSIPKLEDANDAGTKRSGECTLILTEGDSAKALAMAGRGVLGSNFYGVFPLKGKVLNVRDASSAQIMNNKEISAIKKIMGLKNNTNYDDPKKFNSLRYGSIMVMTDQDHDGSHIKGLLINFIHNFWPALLKKDGFLKEFITPIVVATAKRKRAGETQKKKHRFYTLPEYETWKDTVDVKKDWEVKYYKGLGTSTAKEMKLYCSQLTRHKKNFKYQGETCDDRITLAFSKKRIEDRKQWLSRHEEGTFLDMSRARISYTDFVDKELILFSIADNVRSIPCAVDGFKPGQRKILFSCFKRKLKREIKVAQLAGYVSEHGAYHHGEMSLVQTIVAMAQNFCGSNNINLLYPGGQFGTRNAGGKDAASARYIHTRLCPVARKLFHPDDEDQLEFLDDDGTSVEPKWYVPVIPMALVNGSDGIGTGYATSIPNYNPRDIIANIRRLLDGRRMQQIHPFYKYWTGALKYNHNKKTAGYMTIGRVTELSRKYGSRPDVVQIDELPVRDWTEKYKTNVLDKLAEAGMIEDIRTHHTHNTVKFQIQFAPEFKYSGINAEFFKKMKLTGSIATSNMMLFNKDLKIQKYTSPEEIIEEFYPLRLRYYDLRKQAQIKNLTEIVQKLTNKERFIQMIIDDQLIINRRKKKEIVKDLQRHGFATFMPKKKKKSAGDIEAEEDEKKEGPQESKLEIGYKYLLNMPIYSLTYEKIQELRRQREDKETELDKLVKTDIKTIYRNDLDDLELGLEAHEAEEAKQGSDEGIKKKGKKRGGGRGKKAKGSNKGKKEKESHLDKFDNSKSWEQLTDSQKEEIASRQQEMLDMLIGAAGTKGGSSGSSKTNSGDRKTKGGSKKNFKKAAKQVEPMDTNYMFEPPGAGNSNSSSTSGSSLISKPTKSGSSTNPSSFFGSNSRAGKKKSKPASAPKVHSISDSDSSDEELAWAQRLQAKMSAMGSTNDSSSSCSPVGLAKQAAAKSLVSSKSPGGGIKARPASNFGSFNKGLEAKRPAPQPAASKRPAAKSSSLFVDEDSSSDEGLFMGGGGRVNKRSLKSGGFGAATKKRRLAVQESDDDDYAYEPPK